MVDVKVWWADLTRARVDLVELLDATERSRLAGLDLPADRARFVVGVALLRTVAAEYLGTAPADVEIDRTCSECGGPHGRPRIAGGPHVSVSHSGVLVVVATCGSAGVGVDVQRISEMAGQGAGGWTRQEARFKACGPPTDPSTEAKPPVTEGTAASTTIDLDPPLPGYAAALTVTTDGIPRVHTVDLEACPL